jgi:hypothetical protein
LGLLLGRLGLASPLALLVIAIVLTSVEHDSATACLELDPGQGPIFGKDHARLKCRSSDLIPSKSGFGAGALNCRHEERTQCVQV